MRYLYVTNEWINFILPTRSQTGTWVTKNRDEICTINQIRLKKPLEIHTIQPKKYLKWTSEFEYNGHKKLIINTYSHSSHIDILKDNSTTDYSYTYNILSHFHQWWLLICITIIYNDCNDNLWRRCHSAHQAVSWFAQHHIILIWSELCSWQMLDADWCIWGHLTLAETVRQKCAVAYCEIVYLLV